MPTTPKDSNSNDTGGGWGRRSKSLAFWVLVILVPVAFIQFSSGQRDAATELDYTQYEQQLQADNVERVTITAGKTVTGDFRQPVTLERRAVKRFTRIIQCLDTAACGSESHTQR